MSASVEIETLLEPAARAARRGAAEQIKQVLTKLRAAQRNFLRTAPADHEREMARGMVVAIEGMLGYVLASSGDDHRFEILSRYPYALGLMAIIGKHARKALMDGKVEESAIQASEIAKAAGVTVTRLKPILEALSGCGIVLERGKRAELSYELTRTGAHLLEAQWPGWQTTKI